MITIIIVFLSTNFIKSPLLEDNNLRTDCYKSFSDPAIFIKLLHYYPSGPLALRSLFNYTRSSEKTNIEPENVVSLYDFARYDSQCNSSIIFTTRGSDFEKLHLNIKIYHLSYEDREMFNIEYNYYRGFKPGEYELLDLNKNFAIKLKILDVIDKYLDLEKKLIEHFELYINSISEMKGELCIVTENNRAIFVEPKYELNIPKGYITGVYAKVYGKERIETYGRYAAFLCEKNEKYLKDMVIFIIERNAILIIFDIKYLIYKEHKEVIEYHRIKIDDHNFEYVDKFKQIPTAYKKIFLLSRFNDFRVKYCSKTAKATLYVSNYNMYLKIVKKIETISNYVEAYSNFQKFSPDPCYD